MSARIALAALALLPASCVGAAAENGPAPRASEAAFAERCTDWDDWDKPAEPFRIHGNTYYVGTCGITALLVTGDAGHVLIDSGTAAGAQVIMRNVAALGFDLADVKILLNSHEHYDHVGGMAALQRATGATVLTSPQALAVLRTGRDNPADPQAGEHAPMEPVANVQDGLLPFPADGAHPVYLGNLELSAWATPGHTLGALSWTWETCEGSDCKRVVYADSLSPISADGYRFSDHPGYVAAFRSGLAALAELDCDILLTPHPSASEMRTRLLAGDLTSGMNCREYAGIIDSRLTARLAAEAAQ